jgi:hypothetical protein
MLFLQMSATNYAGAKSFDQVREDEQFGWILWEGGSSRNLAVPPLAAQRRQSDAGGVEAAIDRENLSRDVA